ncbi:Cytochrome P450 monooxygenase [Apiospora rasikravindrae]|uniref:Cytochrome P450 monooxygenase n=1 Tax=Apiospora rasikravindrae TaxID=990691 RepID=A0ABR1RXP1_9PEZI
MGVFDTSTVALTAYGAGLVLLYSAALAIYRVTLHPLARFPGPKLAATTEWYEFYHDIVRQGQFIWHIQKLHDQYGPIVRILPNELHIRDPDYYDEIYAPSSKKRDKSEAWVKVAGNTTSAFATVDHHMHRLRRAPLNPFFSKKSITDKESQILEKVEHLCHRLAAAAGSNEIVRVDVAFTALTMDIITDFAFGERTYHLDEPDFGVRWKETLIAQSANAVFLRQFPWLWPVLQRTPLRLLQWLRHPAAGLVVWRDMTRERIERIIATNEAGKRAEGSIFQTVLDSDLPAQEKSAERLEAEAQVVLAAGTETTAKSLAMIAFHLNEDAGKLQRLRDEIATAGPEADGSYSLAKLEKLPYLTACIMEGVRMMSGVTTRLPRVAHEPLQYRDWSIPPGTPVSQMNYVVNNDPDLFPRPLEFRPERWVDAPERADGRRLDRYMVSFMRGSRSCIGINLAWAELYLALAHVVARFDLPSYDTTAERDLVIDRDLFVGVPKAESKGIRAKVVCR